MGKCKANLPEPPGKRPDNHVSVSRETENPSPMPVPCHSFVCLKHWFFRNYILVAALLLGVGIPVALLSSSKAQDRWKAVAAVVGGTFSLGYFTQKQKLEELELFKEIFANFNERYDSLNNELNRIRDAKALLSTDRDILFKYFNLCGEEYLYYRLGYVYPEVWRAWYNGMQFFYKKKHIQECWDEDLATNSYYGLQLNGRPHGASLCRHFCPQNQGPGSWKASLIGGCSMLLLFGGLLHCASVETNKTIAFTYSDKLKEQALKGDASAQFWLAECYANGAGVAKDAKEAINWYRMSADGGDAQIQYWVARQFWMEVDVHGWTPPIPADRKEALKWLRKSAERGHAPAQAMLGRAYEDAFKRGDGGLVPKNETEGLKWLRKAAEQGDSSTQEDLGTKYLAGTAEGVKWLRKYCDYQSEAPPPEYASGDPKVDKSFEKSFRESMSADYYTLAAYYEQGGVVPKDEAQAAKWYRKSAEQGGDFWQVLSQEALGQLYAEGRGVPLDGHEAIKWYQKAADTGSVRALVGIAEVWAFGRGVPKNASEAVKWYKRAAEAGDTVSKFNLGVFYSQGEGVPLDYIEAYKWYNLAAASGYEKASELRNSLALRMTPEQIALAQQRASESVEKKQPGNGMGDGRNSTAEDPSTAPYKASGSGFFITEDGYLLTNAHVVDEAARLVVQTRLGTFSAGLVKEDSVNDIAVLKVSGGFHALPIIPSRTVKLGDTVFTIGFPNPQLQGIDPKLTDGRISSLAGAQDDARQFQISAAVQPGNSGGALVNSSGNVVGIVAARLSDIAAFKTSGALPQNVNYAIKSSYVLSLLESLPEVANKLKEPCSPKERKFEDVVKEAEDATALVIVY